MNDEPEEEEPAFRPMSDGGGNRLVTRSRPGAASPVPATTAPAATPARAPVNAKADALGTAGDEEVSDSEVDEFLAELNLKVAVAPVSEGAIGLDPQGKDMRAQVSLFKEIRSSPARKYLYERGMPDQQMRLTLKDRMVIMAQAAEFGDWPVARRMMVTIWRKKVMRLPMGRILFNLMVKAHAQAGRPKAAESWVVDMLDRVFQPDIITFNTLLGGWAKSGNHHKVKYWMGRMRGRGVQPDAIGYGILINAHAQADDLPGAEAALAEMRESGFGSVGVEPYNSLLKLYASRGLDDRAYKMLKQMKELGMEPSAKTNLLLMQVAAEAKDPISAVNWMETMEKKGQQLSQDHFHAVMTAHAKRGDLAGVQAWMQVMQDKGFGPDAESFNIWLTAAAETGDVDACEDIMKVMKDDAHIEPNVATFSAIIGACAEARDVEGARRWLFRAEAAELEPDLACYNQAIKACARAGNSSQAEHLTRRLLRSRMSPNMATYNALLEAFAQDGGGMAAEFWVDHMQRQARWRHSEFPQEQMNSAYAEVLLAHVRSGNLEAAEDWLTQMLGEGVEPEARCYLAMAQKHLEEGRTDQARNWLERMSSWSGLVPPQNFLESGGGPPQLQEVAVADR